MSANNLGHTVHSLHQAKHLAEAVEKLDRLPEKKNPVLAAIIGLLFGAFGVGVYFGSWKDFFVCMGLFLFLLFAFPILGAPLGWLFSPVYAYYRAVTSNEKHEH